MKGKWVWPSPSLQSNTTNLQCKMTPGFHGGVFIPWCRHLFSHCRVVRRVTHNCHASMVLGSRSQQGNSSCKNRMEAWSTSFLDMAQQRATSEAKKGHAPIDHLCQMNVCPSLQQRGGTAKVLFKVHKAFVGLTQPAGEGAHSLAFADTGRAAVARKGCDEQLGQECLQAAQPHQ